MTRHTIELTDEDVALLTEQLNERADNIVGQIIDDWETHHDLKELLTRRVELPLQYKSDAPWKTEPATEGAVVSLFEDERIEWMEIDSIDYENDHMAFPPKVVITLETNPDNHVYIAAQSVAEDVHEYGWCVTDFNEDDYTITVRQAYGPTTVLNAL